MGTGAGVVVTGLKKRCQTFIDVSKLKRLINKLT